MPHRFSVSPRLFRFLLYPQAALSSPSLVHPPTRAPTFLPPSPSLLLLPRTFLLHPSRTFLLRTPLKPHLQLMTMICPTVTRSEHGRGKLGDSSVHHPCLQLHTLALTLIKRTFPFYSLHHTAVYTFLASLFFLAGRISFILQALGWSGPTCMHTPSDTVYPCAFLSSFTFLAATTCCGCHQSHGSSSLHKLALSSDLLLNNRNGAYMIPGVYHITLL